jgi:hypothetical protein
MGVGADRPTEEKMVDFTVLLIETDHATRLTLDSTGEVVSLETGADPEAPAGAVVDARLLARAAALGVVDMLSTHSATRAVELAGCEVVATVSMNDGLGEDARVAAVLEARPDVILVAGGTDGGDEEHAAPLARIAGRARDEMTAVLGRRPEIAFAGNAEALPTVRDVLGAGTFHETANVRPECEREDLAPAVGLVARLVGGKAFGGADVRTAGSARAVAAAELTRHLDGGVLLLHRVGERAEAASHLAGSWSRVEVASGGVPAAIARHRHRARELQGVPLEREIADAFAGHVPGRDLIDVDPPSLVVATGSLLDLADPVGSATALVEALGPRRVLRLVRGDADLLTLLGAASLLGLEVSRESWGRALEDVGVVVALNGPRGAVRVTLPGHVEHVPAGMIRHVPLLGPSSVMLVPDGRADVGRGPGRSVQLDLGPAPAGLILDTRGTPPLPERRTRILRAS